MRFPTFLGLALTAALASSCGAWKKTKGKLTGEGSDDDGKGGGEDGSDVPPAPKTTADKIRLFLADMTSKKALPEGSVQPLETVSSAYFNPLELKACGGVVQDPAYLALDKQLGGIRWGYGLTYYPNYRTPLLSYRDQGGGSSGGGSDGGMEEGSVANSKAEAGDAAAPGEAPPDIKRADLIGRFGDYVVFLSKRFGLFFVKLPATADGKPELSCSVLVPGQPLNFYVHAGSLVLLTNNNTPGGDAAVIQYAFDGLALKYLGSKALAKREIQDSRMFDDTLAVFSVHTEYKDGAGGGEDSDVMMGLSSPARDERYEAPKTFSSLAVMKVEPATLTTTFEEVFTPEESYADNIQSEPDQSWVGRTLHKSISYNRFVSASDRYLVMGRLTNASVVTGIRTQRHTYQTCVNYNPKAYERVYEACHPIWEETLNPAFDAGFACNDAATFDTCIAQNEAKFVKSYWTYKGQKCEKRSYWMGQCLAYDNVTYVSKSPIVEQETYTDLIVYRFEKGGFVRLDDPTAKTSIRVSGAAKEHKSYNFRNGYFYAVTNQGETGTELHTFKIAGNALVKTDKLSGIAPGEQLKAVLFNDAVLYLVTFRQVDPLFSIDLTVPHKPRVASALKVPGYSSQLISLGDRLLGLGQTAPQNWRIGDRAKVSLYDTANIDDISEIETIELGKDLDYSHSGVEGDDQLYHFQSSAKRLFFPYSGGGVKLNDYKGLVCRERAYEYKNRLSITSVDAGGLVNEADLDVSQSVQRALALDGKSAVAFADAAVYHLKKNEATGAWASTSVDERYVTEGLYSDPSLPAGLMMAVQSKRSGYTRVSMRVILGTKEEILRDTATKIAELPANLLACVGDPRTIRFMDDTVLIGFSSYEYKQDRSIEYHQRFAWRATAEGLVALPDDDAKKLAEEPRTICYLNDEPKPDLTKDEVVHLVTTLTDEHLRCEALPKEKGWLRPVMCSYAGGNDGFWQHPYCQQQY